ncbi:MAG: hypothetical protein ACKO2N_20820, partial [Tabrizicola sp.]
MRWVSGLYERWDKAVAAQRALDAAEVGTPREQWEAGLVRAATLVSGVRGADEDDARALVAESILARYPEDPEDGSPLGVSPQDRT